MWTVIYMANSKTIADKISVCMAQEGILVKVRPISKYKDEDKENTYYEILVPEAEIEEAHNVIIESGF